MAGRFELARHSQLEMTFSQDRADLLEAHQDGAWVLHLDCTVERSNSRAVMLLGQTSVVGGDWRALWPEENRFSLDRALAQALDGQVARFRALLKGVDGARVYCDATIAPARDAEGRIVRLLATARDATQEVESQGFLRSILQMLPSPLTVLNATDRRYIFANRAVEDVLEIAPDDAIGRTVAETMPPRLAERVLAAHEAVLSSGEMQVTEDQLEVRGETRHLVVKTLATYDDIGARHIISLAEDITRQKASAAALKAALAQAEQASRAKSAFLANISHEIRTPLNGIVAGADLLAKTCVDAASREVVDIIAASGRTLDRLLSDVLDLVRIESGRLVIEAAPFDLEDLVRSVGALSALRAAEKGVALSVSVAPAAARRVVGDGDRLRQVLGNLLSNAVKFTDAGKVELKVTLDADGRTFFEVIDTGIGFDAATRERIFDRFQQADVSYTRRFGGMGLGLAISRELVERMGGLLCCESTPSVGSRFWFALPLGACGDTVAPDETQDAAPPTGAPRVLAVDDHPTNRKIVELLLADVAEVTAADNGQEAVALYEMLSPDLVLMDMQMPVMDGLEAVRRIRAMERGGRRARTPIIMLTANGRPEHVAASREAGADLHLQKPITSMALFAAIDAATRACEGHETQAAEGF